MNKNKLFKRLAAIIVAVGMTFPFLTGCEQNSGIDQENKTLYASTSTVTDGNDVGSSGNSESSNSITLPDTGTYTSTLSDMPAYTGNATDKVNGNVPFFTADDMTTESYINLSELDDLGRCGVAMMCASKDTMPADGEKRGEIGSVKPSGWKQAKYPSVIKESPSYLYNRAHLLMWALSGLNDDTRNLITGTRYFNITAMLPYEEQVHDYIENTGEHVIYRVTPLYDGNDLVAQGVLMEAKSVESDGLQFCVFAHNVQPGITINYSDGSSYITDGSDGDYYAGNTPTNGTTSSSTNSSSVASNTTLDSNSATASTAESTASNNSATSEISYIGNKNTMIFHKSDCSSVAKMKDKNKVSFSDRSEAVSNGYTPCGYCNP